MATSVLPHGAPTRRYRRVPWSPRAWRQALYLAGGIPAQLAALLLVVAGFMIRPRWLWPLLFLAVVFLAVPLLTGIQRHRLRATAGVLIPAQPQPTAIRTVTVPQPVTSLTVQTYGDPVQVTAGLVRGVQITETLTYDPQAGGPPAVAQPVSGGHLSLGDPACANSDCDVSFTVTVPSGVTVTVSTEGGPVTVSGIAGANLDSGGGPVRATEIGGPLTVSTGGGPLTLDGLAGTLSADTGGGPLTARGVAAATATITTGGGDARLAFSAAPDTLTVGTDGGAAQLAVPGGPYALTADSGGGPQSAGIATDPAAGRSITVISGGGPLWIGPAGRLPARPAKTGEPGGGAVGRRASSGTRSSAGAAGAEAPATCAAGPATGSFWNASCHQNQLNDLPCQAAGGTCGLVPVTGRGPGPLRCPGAIAALEPGIRGSGPRRWR